MAQASSETPTKRLANCQITKLRNEFQMAQVPSYQAYVVLALLKREKIIISAGRDGYRLPGDIFFPGRLTPSQPQGQVK